MTTTSDPSPSEVEQRLERMRQGSLIAIRAELGIRSLVIDQNQMVEEMDVQPWHFDARGEVAPGVLGLLVDAVLGRSVMVAVPVDMGMATSHLHLELLRPIPPDTKVLRCTGAARAVEDRFGLSEGEVVTDAGVVVARASLGAILFGARRTVPSGVDDDGQLRTSEPTSRTRPHRLIKGSPIYEALGTRVVSARASGIRITNPAAARWANLSRGVFGGVGVLMGERAMDLASQASGDPEAVMRPVELRAAYVRPIPADGSLIECHAQVMYRGRRLAVVRAEVRGPDGRVAVLVDGSYIPVSS